jgi:hypothetical protein
VNNSTQARAAEVFDAMNTGLLEKIRDLVTDDFVDHGSPVPLLHRDLDVRHHRAEGAIRSTRHRGRR